MEPCCADEKYEGFDIWEIRSKADAVKCIQELTKKPEMQKAVQKYLREEETKAKQGVDLVENL